MGDVWRVRDAGVSCDALEGRRVARTSACWRSTWSSIAMLSMERWRSIDALSTTFIA